MIIRGGFSGLTYPNDGGRYNPAANRWMRITTSGAPAGRSQHTAVWTGSEMIVWGGSVFSGFGLNDTWSTTPPKPLYLYLRVLA